MAEPIVSRLHRMRLLYAVVAALTAIWPVTGAQQSAVPSDDATLTHVLSRLTYGPRRDDFEHIRKIGVAAFIDEQLAPQRLADVAAEAKLTRLSTITMSTHELAERYFIPALIARRELKRNETAAGHGDPETTVPRDGAREASSGEPIMLAAAPLSRRPEAIVISELTEQRVLRAVYSRRQLQEVMVDFWFNHFNVFAGKGAARLYLTEYERDVIRPHALGNFRDLLGAVAKSPAMLFYLDNWMSTDPNAADDRLERQTSTRRAAGSQFGPRVGRPGTIRDSIGSQRPTTRSRGLNENYARELMELHTLGVDGGYTQDDVVAVARAFTGWTIEAPRAGGGFRFDARRHDEREKVVLGQVIWPGGGQRDGERVLDILASHPSTARFIAAKLARRFVSDDPPAAVIDRAAARFRETRGDITQVVRSIVTSPEFLAPEVRRAKVKTPFEFIVSAIRSSGARVDRASSLAFALRELGMPLYFAQPPTGYPDRADAWVTSGALVGRMNFAVSLFSNRIRGVFVDLPALGGSRGGTDGKDTLIDRLLPAEVSSTTMATLAKARDAPTMAALAVGAPEFQKR